MNFSKSNKSYWISTFSVIVFFGTFSGCFLPRKPGSNIIAEKTLLSPALEWNKMSRIKLVQTSNAHGTISMTPTKVRRTGRDAILISTDDEVQKYFEKQLQSAYHSDGTAAGPIRLEEVMWWAYAPIFRDLYDHVLRVPYDRFTSGSLVSALETLEKTGRPYDLILMTHGVPNELVTSYPAPNFTWKDLGELKGKLKHLQLVFMQACFGDTLVGDWHAAGAQAVLSFNDFNRNFFYLPFYLKNLKKAKWDVAQAQSKTLKEINQDLKGSALYRKIIGLLLKSQPSLGTTINDYLKNSPPPKLSLAQKTN